MGVGELSFNLGEVGQPTFQLSSEINIVKHFEFLNFLAMGRVVSFFGLCQWSNPPWSCGHTFESSQPF